MRGRARVVILSQATSLAKDVACTTIFVRFTRDPSRTCVRSGGRPHLTMRIFIALDIDQPIRERIERFLEGVRGFAPDARWVRPESLHITLKFIGEKRPESVGLIKSSLAK